MKTYGYARVSAKDQREDRQLRALAEYGISRQDIFVDKRSGKDFDRPAWTKLMKRIRPGDLLVMPSVDRLGRNYDKMLRQWQHITEKLQADILVLDMPILDTRQRNDLTGKLISDIVLGLLSYVAQKEHEAIRKRQAEGIAIAKARGVRFGRRPKAVPDDFDTLRSQWQSGMFSSHDFASRCGISRSTLFKWLKERRDEESAQDAGKEERTTTQGGKESEGG